MKYPSRSEPTYLALMSVDEKIPSIDGGEAGQKEGLFIGRKWKGKDKRKKKGFRTRVIRRNKGQENAMMIL